VPGASCGPCNAQAFPEYGQALPYLRDTGSLTACPKEKLPSPVVGFSNRRLPNVFNIKGLPIIASLMVSNLNEVVIVIRISKTGELGLYDPIYIQDPQIVAHEQRMESILGGVCLKDKYGVRRSTGANVILGHVMSSYLRSIGSDTSQLEDGESERTGEE
jgi:hypothetical protein